MFDTRFAKDNNLNHITFGIYKKKYNGHAKGIFYKNNVRRSKSCGSLDDAKYKIDNYCNNDNQCIKEAIAFHYGLVGNEFVNRYNQMQKYCDAEKKSNNNLTGGKP